MKSGIRVVRLVTGESLVCEAFQKGDTIYTKLPARQIVTHTTDGVKSITELKWSLYAPDAHELTLEFNLMHVITMYQPSYELAASYAEFIKNA